MFLIAVNNKESPQKSQFAIIDVNYYWLHVLKSPTFESATVAIILIRDMH